MKYIFCSQINVQYDSGRVLRYKLHSFFVIQLYVIIVFTLRVHRFRVLADCRLFP